MGKNSNKKTPKQSFIEKITKKRNFAVIAMILTMIVIIAVGSFALVLWSSDENTEVTVRIGNVAGVYFDKGPDINVSNMGPIFDYEKDGESTNFKITNFTNDKVALIANLNIEKISEELQREDFKFAVLSSVDEENYNLVNEGNFKDAQDKTAVNLFTNEVLESNAVVSYKVIIYIDGNVENSIEMQDESLQGVITVNSVEEGSEVLANSPAILEGLIPVVHNGTTWVTADASNYKNNWYDYDTKKWANAVLVSSAKRSGLTKDANGYYTPGQIIGDTESDGVLAFYVWIPRFKYKVWNIEKRIGTDSYGAETKGIDIVFEPGTETTGTINCNYSYNSASSSAGSPNETCTGVNGEYYTHPAFTFGDAQLTGFWIGKYELSSSNSTTTNGGGNVTNLTARVLPNVVSWRNNTLSNYYKVIKDMQVSSNIYGLPTNTIDSHMLTNMEWGALAYLTHSGYGRCTNGTCTEVAKNNSSSYYTGRSSGSGGSTGSSAAGTYTYTTSNGMLASTTGNITGVYDVSGGSLEYVMGNMSSASGNYKYYAHSAGSNFSYSSSTSKYLTPYAYGTTYGDQTAYNRGRLGDSTGEIVKTTGGQGGWYSDTANFASSTDGAWFVRGGGLQSDSTASGIFYFGRYPGGVYSTVSTRSALAGVTTYTITYDANGGTGAPAAQTKSHGGIITLSSDAPVKEGYLFAGWNTKQDGSGEQYQPGSAFKTNANTTLYAQWGTRPIYVYYNVNGGVVNEKTNAGTWTTDSNGFVMKNEESVLQIINNNSSTGTNGFVDWDDVTYMNVIRQGYSAKTGYEYNTKSDGTGASFADNKEYSYDTLLSYVTNEGDYYRLDLYVNWNPNTYTVSYYLGNGTSTKGVSKLGTSSCTYGTSCQLTTFADLNGTFPGSTYNWNFYGWTPSIAGTSSTYTNGASFTYNIAGDINLYALGRKVIYFNTGISPTSASKTMYQYWNPYSTEDTYLTAISLPSETDLISYGWTFTGYKFGDDIANSNVTYASSLEGKNVKPAYDNDSQIRSVYERILTVAYNSNGGTGTIASNTATQFYNSGYASNSKNVGANASTVTVTLKDNGFTAPKGHSFSGKWAEGSTGGTQYATKASYSYAPTVNSTATTQTMYAIWNRNQYTVTLNKGTGISAVTGAGTYYYGDSVTIDATVSSGYTWSKWTGASTVTTKQYTFTLSDSNVTYTANATVNCYDVTLNKGTGISAVTGAGNYCYGDSVTIDATVESGYTWSKWTGTHNTTTQKYTFTMPNNAVTNTATTTINTYNVTLNKGTGILDVTGAGTYVYKSNVSIDATLREGYKWNKWTGTHDTATQNYTFTMPNSDVTDTANAVGNSYTVTLNPSGGSVSSTSKSVTYQSTYGTLPSPTKTGYTFKGWQLVPNEYQQVDYIQSSGTQYINTGYYWQNENIEIYFDGTVTSNSSGQSLFGNEEYIASSGSDRSFSGIPHGSNGSYAIYLGNGNQINVSTTIGTRFTLDIITNASKKMYVYKDNALVGAKTYSGTVKANASAYKASSASTTVGHIFLFANHNSERGSTNAATQNVGGMKVYAFKLYDNGTLVRDLVPCYRKSDNVIGMYDRVNGVFYTNAGSGTFTKGTDTYITSTSKVEIPRNHTLYANFGANQYTVTLNNQGATTAGTTSVTASYERAMPSITPPTKTGFAFQGYYSTASGDGKKYYNADGTSALNYDVAGNTTLYARWGTNSYNITYVLNGGTGGSSAPTAVAYDSVVTISNPTKSGFTFLGWTFSGGDVNTALYGTSSSTVTTKWSNASTKVTAQYFKNLSSTSGATVTMTANWQKIVTATYKYYNNQATTNTCTIGNTGTTCNITLPSTPSETPDGYTFVGWSTSSTCNASTAITSGTVSLSSNQTYHACYGMDVNVSFYYSGLAATDKAYSTPHVTAPTVKGTRYMGYNGTVTNTQVSIPTAVSNSKGGAAAPNYQGVANAVNSATTLTSANVTTANTKYYAVYSENITFYYYNGSAHTSTAMQRRMLSNGTNYVPSLSATAPTPSTYSGFAFVGWSETSASLTPKAPTATDVESIYAYYQKTISVSYNANGCGTAPSSQSLTKTYISQTSSASLLSSSITLASQINGCVGKNLSSWNTVAAGTGTSYALGATYTGTDSLTLYAQFNTPTYTLTYDYTGGSVATANKTSYTATTATFTLNNPTRTSYTFSGYTEQISTSNWYTGFVNMDTGALETNGSYPNSVYSEPIYLEKGVTYTITGTSLGGIRWRYYNTSGTYIGSASDATFTPTDNVYARILLYEGATAANRNAMIISSSQGTSVSIIKGSTGNRKYIANWGVYPKITYNYNDSYTYNANEYMDTGYFVNWDEDFTIEETINVSTTSKRYLLIGNYNGSDTEAINVELTDANLIRVYLGTGGKEKTSSSAITIGEDIVFTFSWNTVTDTYTVTAKGTKTNITMTGTYTMSGISDNDLRVGTSDLRSGASSFNPITVKSLKITNYEQGGSTLSDLPTATKIGQTFGGWNTNAAGTGTVITTSSIMPTSDVTYYAQWNTNKYTISYDACGGTGAPASQTKTYGVALTLSSTIPTKTGHTFKGWSTGGCGQTSATYQAGGSYTANASASLSAVWQVNKYTVTLNKGTGISAVTGAGEYEYGASVTIDATVATGYTWSKWTGTHNNQTTKQYTFTMPASNVTDTANATVNCYDVTLNKGTGISAVTGAGNYCYGDSVTIDATVSSGYTWSGWTGTKASTTKQYTFTMPNNAVTNTANATANTYTISYYLGNGTSTAGSTKIGTTNCTYDSSCTLTTWANFGKTFPGSSYGWVFNSWIKDDEDGISLSNTLSDGLTFSYTRAGDLNLYALGSNQYEFFTGIAPTSASKPSNAIQYWNPHSTADSQLTSITFPSPTAISGWTFYGYVAASNDAEDRLHYAASTAGTSVKPAYNAYRGIRAVYKRTLTIAYNANGGSGTVSNQTGTQYYNSGANTGGAVSSVSFTLSANSFVRTGYYFNKWALGSASGTQYAAGASYSMNPAVTATAATDTTKTMYATWTAKPIKVYYNVNGGTIAASAGGYSWSADSNGFVFVSGSAYSQTINYGGSTSSDGFDNYNNSSWLNITKTGHTAVSGNEWKTEDNQKFSMATKYTYDQLVDYAEEKDDHYRLDLYVNWTPGTYTVYFHPNNGSVSTTSKSVTYGSTYGTLPTPTRSGHIFNGWYNGGSHSSMTWTSSSGNYNYQNIRGGLRPGITYTVTIGGVSLTAGSISKMTSAVYDATIDGILERTDNVTFANGSSYSLTVPTTADASHDLRLLLYAGVAGATANKGMTLTNIVITTDGTKTVQAYTASSTVIAPYNHELLAHWEASDTTGPTIDIPTFSATNGKVCVGATFTVSCSDSSGVSSISATYNGSTKTGTSSVSFTAATTNKDVSVTCKDTKGNTSTKTATINRLYRRCYKTGSNCASGYTYYSSGVTNSGTKYYCYKQGSWSTTTVNNADGVTYTSASKCSELVTSPGTFTTSYYSSCSGVATGDGDYSCKCTKKTRTISYSNACSISSADRSGKTCSDYPSSACQSGWTLDTARCQA